MIRMHTLRTTAILLALSALAVCALSAPASGGSLVFDKKGHVDCGDIFHTPRGTVEFWIKPATTQNNEWVMSMKLDKANQFILGFGPGIFMFNVIRAGENRYAFIDSKTLPVGVWSHVAWTFDKDQTAVFLNGRRIGHKTNDPGGNYGLDHLAGAPLLLGRGPAEKEYFNGLLGEVRLSEGVRYTRDFTAPKAALDSDAATVALWRFDAPGDVFPDASGQKRDARIVNVVGYSTESPLTAAPPAPPAASTPPPPTAPARPVPPPPVALSNAPTRAMIRGDGVLVVDDRPIFPIAMRTEQADSIRPIAEAGFNMLHGSGEWEAEHYAAAQANNLLVLGGHYVWATFASFRGQGGINLRTSEEAGIKTVLKEGFNQHRRLPLQTLAEFDRLPGVIGWNTNEEPEAKLTEVTEYAYEIFKSHSPGHLVASLSCDPRWFHLWRNTADILIVDNYPFRGSARNKRSLLETYEWIRDAQEAMPGKAVWLMSQLIPPSDWSRVPEDELTLGDVRLQHYLGLIAGAKGVIMYHWASLLNVYRGSDRMRVSPEVFQKRMDIVKAMVAELRQIGPVICATRPTRDLEIRWLEPGAQGPGPQLTRELDGYGVKYLLAANLLDVPVKARVYGINGGNPRAYTTKVWLGGDQLSVEDVKPGEPEITVGPRGAGIFILERIPVPPAE